MLLCGILHHFADERDPASIVKAYMDVVPAGSHLLITHFHRGTPEAPELERKFIESIGTGWFRTEDQIRSYFLGMELVGPGLVPVSSWRPDPGYDRELWPDIPTQPLHNAATEPTYTPNELLISGGMARKA